MLFAKLDRRLVDSGIGPVGDDVFCVLLVPVWTPHSSGGSDRGWHRGINYDVAWHVQVGDSGVGINHGEIGPLLVDSLNFGFDLGSLFVWQFRDLRKQVSQTIIGIDSDRFEITGVVFENVLEENGYPITCLLYTSDAADE